MSATKSVRRLALTLLGALLAVVGVTAGVLAATASPDFSLGANPTSQSIQQGQTASYTVTVGALNGFSGTVTLATSGLPRGTTATFPNGQATLATAPGTTTLTVSTTSTTPIGSSNFTVSGTSGKLKHSTTLGLTVNYALSSSYNLAISPTSVSVPPNSTAAYTVNVSGANWSSPVTLTAYGSWPTGVTPSFSPNPVTISAQPTPVNMTVTVASGVANGTYTLYVVGSSKNSAGTNVYQYAQTQLVVDTSLNRPFSISGGTAALLAPGRSAAVDLTITNPNTKQISVTNLSVSLASVRPATNTASCALSNYSVTQFSGAYPFTVPAGGSVKLSNVAGVTASQLPTITMLNTASNQDGCKGATLSLSYAGSGTGG